MLLEALYQGEHGRIFSPQVSESSKNPGKFVVNIDGTPMMNFEVDTEKEAMAFVQGFVMGFSVGGGIKNIADGRLKPI
jgi:hypothetical protein